MNVSRRSFLRNAASCGAFWGLRAFAAPHGAFSSGTPRLAFGALSDIHVFCPRAGKGPGGLPAFEHALAWFKARNADAVLVGGDIANWGLTDELELAAGAWRKVFPDDRAADGRKVEKVFVTGNHDHDAWHYGTVAKDLYPDPKAFEEHKLVNDYRRHWRAAFGEEYEPIFMKEIKGYRFIGSHWDAGDFAQFGPRLKAFVAAHRDALAGEKPFFYLQHPVVAGTVGGAVHRHAGDRGKVTATDVLSAFPNAVALSGHTHLTLGDERAIWQGTFTSVTLGCLIRVGFLPTANTDPVSGYENGRTPGVRRPKSEEAKAKAVALDEAKATPCHKGMQGCSHGTFVQVYDDRIVIARMDFRSDRPVGDDWVIPLAPSSARPYEYARRAAAARAPEFTAGAALALATVQAKTRGKATKDCLRIDIPAAVAVAGVRPHEYRIEIESEKGEKCVRSVIAAGEEQSADSPAAKGPTTCLLALDTLPAGRLVLKVYPGECFGRLGRPLAANWTHDSRSAGQGARRSPE